MCNVVGQYRNGATARSTAPAHLPAQLPAQLPAPLPAQLQLPAQLPVMPGLKQLIHPPPWIFSALPSFHYAHKPTLTAHLAITLPPSPALKVHAVFLNIVDNMPLSNL